MISSKGIRQFHRWLSVTFTAAVVLNLIVMGRGDIAMWIGLGTLVPLILLMITGLYMFALPYAARWRARRVGG
ncbi:hypothetical protein [Paradevosia shaoguanensis]|uniref:hypothetical protein n=1 Tax=Paradevosia shaoguanensis TaxID=1335043 RepID=UPI003C70F45F